MEQKNRSTWLTRGDRTCCVLASWYQFPWTGDRTYSMSAGAKGSGIGERCDRVVDVSFRKQAITENRTGGLVMSNLYSCAIIVQQHSKVFLVPGCVEADSEAEAHQIVMERILKHYPSDQGFYNYNIEVAEIDKKDIVAFIGRWAKLMIPLDQ